MKTALFVMVPNSSHYYPTFGFAHLLKKRGYCVIYGGMAQNRSTILREGFSFELIDYVEEFIIRKLFVAFGLWYKTRMDPSYTIKRYKTFLSKMKSLERLVVCTNPDVIFLDITLGHYYPCLVNKVKLIQLSTRLSSKRRYSIPPLNSLYIPSNNYFSSLIANLQWIHHIKYRKFNEQLQKVIFNNYSDIDFLQHYQKQRNVDRYTTFNKNSAFYDTIINLPTLILAPKSLEFKGTKDDPNEYYLHTSYQRNESNYFSEEYIHFIQNIHSLNEIKKPKIVLVALGTLSHTHAHLAYQLLLKISKALCNDTNVSVLMATGGFNLPNQQNILCLPFIPQLNALTYCDLMITHGGLNSIKECVTNGVPMLVYPINADVDQPGNSARIVNMGLGLRGKISDSPDKILKKVHTILNTPAFKNKCRLMQQNFLKDEQEAQAIINQLGL